MKLATFFEKFELFAEAPDAVARMREVIRHLAVNGLIFGQDHGSDTKNDWKMKKLGEVAQFINGDRSKNYPSKSVRVDQGVPFINAGHLLNGNVDMTNMDFITAQHFELLGSGKIKLGDVLFCLRGSLGKCAVVRNISQGAIASSLLIIRPLAHILPDYIYLCLVSPLGAQLIKQYDNGSAQPNLSATNVKKFIIPLPPLAEQKRIVAKVDALMALCDQLEAQQQERQARHAALVQASLARFTQAPTPDNLQFLFHPSYTVSPADLRKTILTLAVQGKLVPQDQEDEPSQITFPVLAKAAIAQDDDSFPSHWMCIPLGKVGEWRGGGTPSKSQAEFWEGDIPWISPKDMKTLYISDAQDHISEEAVEKSSVRKIPPGSLLMVVRGMILARAFPVAIAAREVTINQDMKALLPFEAKIKGFLLVVLRALEPHILSVIERSSHGTCKLQTNVLHRFEIPLPPLAEQRRIVAKVDELMALIDDLEAQLTTSLTLGQNLMAALVRELTTKH